MNLRERIEKRINTAKIFKKLVLIWGCIAVATVIIALVKPGLIVLPIFMVLGTGVMIILYIELYSPVSKSVKLLETLHMELGSVLGNIDSSVVLPKSKVVCCESVFVVQKNCAVIPYKSVLWIYQNVTKVFGAGAVDKTVIVLTHTGKQFNINTNIEELKWMIENNASKFRPECMIGYSEEYRKRYFELVKTNR